MSTTGRELLGRHLYDILSPNDPQVMTIGNFSNNAYITFYESNMPLITGYNIGLCNQTFNITNNYFTTKVGINTLIARNTLDVEGTIAVNKVTTYSNIRGIDFTNTSLCNVNDIRINGFIYQNDKPFIAPWTHSDPIDFVNTNIYTLSNVGIGVKEPVVKLDVAGDIKFTNRLLHNGEEFRESPFRYLIGNAQSNTAPYDIMLSNMYYLHNVGIGTNSCNELVNYKFFVKGNVAVDGKLYANDFISYTGAAANSYKEFTLYGVNPNYENKTVVTNDANDINTVLFEFVVRGGRYLAFANIPYINRSPFIFIDNQNWVDIVLYEGPKETYTKNAKISSKITIDIRDVNVRNTQTFEFFIEAGGDKIYTIAARGKGHTIEFGGISLDAQGVPYLELDQTLRLFAIKGIGLDDSFTVRKALQVNPIRTQAILTENTDTFTFRATGQYDLAASNVDIFINGIKYVYLNETQKDFDVQQNYNFTEKITTFTINLTEPAQQNDVIDISLWPTTYADTIYSSGYYYQQINTYPTQWLNVDRGGGIRYHDKVIIDGDLIVRGNIVGGCNTEDYFPASLPAGDLSITCNVVGTLNIIDGSITLGKMAPNSVDNSKILKNSIHPERLDTKNKIMFLGCNYGDITPTLQQIPSQRGLYVDGDVFIKGVVQASTFAGNTESIADGSISTNKLATESVTYPKIAKFSISNDLIPGWAINHRTIAPQTIYGSNLIFNTITTRQLGLNSVQRSNINPRTITSNEIDIGAILPANLNLNIGNVGIGTLNPVSVLHVRGTTVIDGDIYSRSNNTFSLGLPTNKFHKAYIENSIYINDIILRRTNDILNPGFETVNTLGLLTKNNFGELYTSNIGIGTLIPNDSLDLNYGGILVRNGSIGIGTTYNKGATIDAITPPNSKLLINQIGIGTQTLFEPFTIFGGGLYINSNSEPFVFRKGNVGIGTTEPLRRLHIQNGGILLQDGNIDSLNGSLTVSGDISGAKINANNNVTINGSITTSNIYNHATNKQNSTIGDGFNPFTTLYAKTLVVGSEGSNITTITQIPTSIYQGDDYNFYTVPLNIPGQPAYTTIQPPLNILNNVYSSGSSSFQNFYPLRNLVINGNMIVNQRIPGRSSNISQTNTGLTNYTIDRHATIIRNSTGTINVGQSNIRNSIYYSCKVGINTTSVGSTSVHTLFSHKIENVYTRDLGWGTQNASPITVTFDIISTATNTYYLSIQNASKNRSFVRNINVTANISPTKYAFIIPGDSNGDWRNTSESDTGIILNISTDVGSTYNAPSENVWYANEYYGITSTNTFMNNVNTTFNVTNVQLEAGYFPTVFEKRSYPLELSLCKRYFEKSYDTNIYIGSNIASGSTSIFQPATATEHTSGSITLYPKRYSRWIGNYYSIAGTYQRVSQKNVLGTYTDLGTGNPPSTGIGTAIFSERGENSFSYLAYLPAIASRTFAFHWTVDAEL